MTKEEDDAKLAAEKAAEEAKKEAKEKAATEEATPDDKITQANAAADRMKLENDRHEALLLKQEAMKVAETLGGKAEAGQKKEEPDKDQEEADKLMAITQ